MKYSLIAIDLDGTALGSDPTALNDHTKNTLSKAHDRGYHIAVATGRYFPSLPEGILDQKWTDYGVLTNGAEVWDLKGKKAIELSPMSIESIQQLNRIAQNLDIALERGDDAGHYHITEHERKVIKTYPLSSFHLQLIEKRACIDDSKTINNLHNISKINVPHIEPKKYNDFAFELKKLPITYVDSSEFGIEITGEDITKAKGIESICKKLNISMASVFALGDSGNDQHLLEAAGFGVAMGNAPDFVKGSANAVTLPNTENGAAAAIERYLF